MAMTLRIPADLDARLEARATREHRSKHQIILNTLQAAEKKDTEAAEHAEEVIRLTEGALIRWRPTLDRLADA